MVEEVGHAVKRELIFTLFYAVGVFVKDLVTTENHLGLLMVMEYSGWNSSINFIKKGSSNYGLKSYFELKITRKNILCGNGIHL